MKLMQIIIFLLAVAMAFTGCTGDDEKPTGKTKLAILIAPDQGGGWKAVADAFMEKNPGISVELREGPASTDERENMYTTSFMAEDAVYDLVYMDIIWVPKLASKSWLEPLDENFPAAQREKFLPGDIAGSVYNAKIYRVPMQSDAGMLYYRKDLLEKAGLKPPETFDELLTHANKIQSPPDMWGFVFQGMQYEGLVCNFLEILWGHGADVIDSNGKVVLDSPEGTAALSWLVKAVRADKICPPGVTTYQEEESRNIFHEGRAVFMRNWPYAWGKAQEEGSKIKDKIGIIPMVHAPGKKSAATLGGWGLGISAHSRNKEAAWKFIEFATSAKMQKLFHEKKSVIPTRKSLFSDKGILEKNPHYGELYKVLLAARPRPVHPRYAEISDVMQLHVSSALVGKETPQEAVKKMAEEIKAKLESR
ncbi:MAG: ABC transporter substrate-binding protein [Planctomycetota bacterium]|jgi:multiple sugar transport system substrate-binding protein